MFFIRGYKCQLDFKILPIDAYEMVLGKLWLFRFNPQINWRTHQINFTDGDQDVELIATKTKKWIEVVEPSEFNLLLKEPTPEIYICRLNKIEEKTEDKWANVDLEMMDLIKEYQDVFPDSLPIRLLLKKKVKYEIELILGVEPLVQIMYKLSPREKE